MIKDKLMKIGDVAARTDLSVKTIRYYADIGLVTPASRSSSGYRTYDQDSIGKLIFVRRAREFDFSIEECRELLDLYSDKKRTSAAVKKIASSRLHEIERKQQELQALHDDLSRFIDCCPGNDMPDCPILDNFSEEKNISHA